MTFRVWKVVILNLRDIEQGWSRLTVRLSTAESVNLGYSTEPRFILSPNLRTKTSSAQSAAYLMRPATNIQLANVALST
jgi:hypothetical protein